MFNKDEKNSKEIETVIGPSVKVRGDFIGSGNLLIEGDFEGNIETSGDIRAGEGSKIVANIKAAEAAIYGLVTGDIQISGLLEIGSKANIQGNIVSGRIQVSNGAIINGTIKMISSDKNPSVTKAEN